MKDVVPYYEGRETQLAVNVQCFVFASQSWVRIHLYNRSFGGKSQGEGYQYHAVPNTIMTQRKGGALRSYAPLPPASNLPSLVEMLLKSARR